MSERPETIRLHRGDCLAAQAWDIPEAYDHCRCSFPWPMRVCTTCWNQPHQHKRDCRWHSIPDSSMARFLSRISVGEGCWTWRGKLNGYGYGRLRQGGREFLAHRYAYALGVGPIPEGLQIDHTCRNRACVRPSHLRAVTPRENLLAPGSESIAAANYAKASCPTCGGAYTLRSDGHRQCRTCRGRRRKGRVR